MSDLSRQLYGMVWYCLTWHGMLLFNTCSALLGRAVLLSRLPPSPYIDENIDTCPKVFSTFQWPVGVSTSGHFYLCWMLPLPSWNWPAGAVAQPTCRRSSWKVKVKTKIEIELFDCLLAFESTCVVLELKDVASLFPRGNSSGTCAGDKIVNDCLISSSSWIWAARQIFDAHTI